VPFDGKSDTLSTSGSQLSFGLEAGKLSYLWVSTSGTLTTTAKGQSGTFSATLVPSATGTATGNDMPQSHCNEWIVGKLHPVAVIWCRNVEI